jgi:16S rRNA (adenine1518-N6/adenine1519-N6)-dimethyltransferase
VTAPCRTGQPAAAPAGAEPGDVRALLRRYKVRPKHGLGQNFLVDAGVYRRIVAAAGLAPEDWVVEVGAGLGTLTRLLAAAAASGRVLALERDAALAPALQAELRDRPNVEVWFGDAVAYDLGAAAARAGRTLVMVGNLPYQISSPILFRLVEERRQVRRAVLMLQREVAERVTAPAGSPAYGGITVLIGLHFQARIAFGVGRRAFLPPPRVDSAVVRLEARAEPAAPVADEAYFARVVRAAFGQRRKTLRNALRALEPGAAIDPQRRGETLDLGEFARLAVHLRPGR